jgi:hypothetical protein
MFDHGMSYRQLIVRNSKDPTFVFLAILWSALYAWDEALEVLYKHFSWLVRKLVVCVDFIFTLSVLAGPRNLA